MALLITTVSKLSELCTVDEGVIENMVKEALSVAKVDVSEKYMHTCCKHAASVGQSAAITN